MMKSLILTLALGACTLGLHAQTTVSPIDTAGFQTFIYHNGDTAYIMKQYFICFLKAGPLTNQTQEEAARIQAAHLAHITALANDRKICLSGPFGDDGQIRGILVFNTPTLAEAERLANLDPAVLSGRLTVEIHPWWTAIGGQLF